MKSVLWRKEVLTARRCQNIQKSLTLRCEMRPKCLIWNTVSMSAEHTEVIVVCAGTVLLAWLQQEQTEGKGGAPGGFCSRFCSPDTITVTLLRAARQKPGQEWLPWQQTLLPAVLPSLQCPPSTSHSSPEPASLLHVCQGRPCQPSWCETWIWSHDFVASETSSKALSVPLCHLWPGWAFCILCCSPVMGPLWHQLSLVENVSSGKQQFLHCVSLTTPCSLSFLIVPVITNQKGKFIHQTKSIGWSVPVLWVCTVEPQKLHIPHLIMGSCSWKD